MRCSVLLISLLLPSALAAQAVVCPNSRFTVENGAQYTEHVCEVVEAAARELSACNLPISRRVNITLLDELEENCVGLYHCSDDRIEVLHPDQLELQIPNSALFSALEPLEYFDSVVFHELVHAAFDEIPCPFQSCAATSEYLAYALQIRNLSDDARKRIGLDAVPEEQVSRQKFSAIMAFWVPDRFALDAWAHLMQRPDPCAYVGSIAAGNILFDTETPFILAPPD